MKIQVVETGNKNGVEMRSFTFQAPVTVVEKFWKLYPKGNLSATLRQTLEQIVEEATSEKHRTPKAETSATQ